MTDVSRLQVVRHALHTNNATFTGTPGTLYPLRTTQDALLLPRQRTVIERPLRSSSGRRYPHARGIQDVGDITIPLEFKGVNANTGAAVTDWEAKQEAGYILQSMFGAVAPATAGAAPTVNTSGHTPASGIISCLGTSPTAGQVIGFPTDQGFQVGRVASVSGVGPFVATLDHPYNGTPTSSATIIRAAVYTVDDDLTHHIHMFMTGEGENWRRDFFGCAPNSFSIVGGENSLIAFNSVWSPTSYADVAEANPTHAEPTAGSPVIADSCNVWFAGLALQAFDFSIEYSNAMTVRRAQTKANGKLGSVAATGDGKMFKVSLSAYIGDATISGEIRDSAGTISLNDILGDAAVAGDLVTTRKLSLQLGAAAGECAYAYLPEADVRASLMDANGLTAIKIEAIGTGALPGILAVL